eukprot:GSChrysophyteH1.ASY1.ANO1.1142.1 assembled CDS
MRAARARGNKPSQAVGGGGQFKLSASDSSMNGEMKSIMNLLQPGRAGNNTKYQQQPVQHFDTKRSTSVPNISTNSTTEFDDELNDEEIEPTFAPNPSSLDDVYHFRAELGGASSQSPSNNNQEVIDALKGDIVNLQHALHSERNRGQGQAKVAGAQFRMGGREFRCENCISLTGTLKKSKESIRSLKLQLDRLQDKYAGLRKSKSFDNDLPASTEDIEALRKRSDDYELELSRLKKSSKSDQLTIEQLQKMLLEWQLKDEENKALITNYIEGQERSDIAREEQQRVIDKLRSDLSTYQMQLEAAELKLSSYEKGNESLLALEMENKRLRDKIAALTAEKDEVFGHLQDTRQSLDDSNRRLEATENSRLAAIKSKDEIAEMHAKEVQECAKAKEELGKSKEDLCAKEKERAQTAQLLQESKGKIAELANENVELLQEISRIRQLLEDQQASKAETQSALEKAIAQSVRLCVVAPTVNVHVSDKKMKFRGGLEDKNLKQFLDKEILEKYSIMFKQENEGKAPDGVTSIQGWLHKLLGEMQKSIEMHVNNAMNSEGGSV